MTLSAPPRADEVEVSLFGPGIGECVVVHLGAGEWMVVDSCIDPATREPAALGYLKALGVDVASAVKQVVVSHWHDDHTRGVSRVLDAAVGAELVCSAALRRDEFRTLIAASRSLNLKDQASSGLDEIDRVLEIVRTRRGGRPSNGGPTWAQGDSLIHRRTLAADAPECEVFALSPSSATLTRSLHDIAELLPKLAVTKRATVNVAPNDTALVISVRCGEAVALLGRALPSRATCSGRGSRDSSQRHRPRTHPPLRPVSAPSSASGRGMKATTNSRRPSRTCREGSLRPALTLCPDPLP